jgi:hypothetical protein
MSAAAETDFEAQVLPLGRADSEPRAGAAALRATLPTRAVRGTRGVTSQALGALLEVAL